MTPRILLGRALFGAALAGAATMPAVLEEHGRAAAARAWACGGGERACGALGRLDLAANGVTIEDAWRDVGGWRVASERLTLALEDGTLEVRATGVTLAEAEPRPKPQPRAQPASTASPARARPRSRRVPSTHGVPVDVAIEGAVELRGPAGTALRIADAHAALDGHGGLVVDAVVDVRHPELPVTPTLRVRGTAQDGDLDRVRVQGELRLDPTRDALQVEATLDGSARELTMTAPDGGSATLRPLGPRAVLVHTRDFPLAAAAPLWQAALPSAIDPRHATVSGTIEAHLGAHPRLHLTGVALTGVAIDDPRIAREPLELDGVEIIGDVGLSDGGGFADVVLARGEAELGVSVALDPSRLAVSLELPAHECQTLLDALPAAMKDTLGGMRMAGHVEGHVRLTIDRSALASARGGYDGAPGEVPPRPGELDLELPVLEACTVIADPAAIDLDALLGPYRHRFATAGGDSRTRTLAPGAPGFAPLSSVRLVADAFVTLEDRRFFAHDGFDREQMENALWHNLVRGGVQRGASTISQQATRNLWLGVDRSLARKLQEALLTARLEAEVPKDRILELYLNVIELGPDVHGVEAAAQYWFGKSAAELDVREAVHLAALAPAPRRFARRFRDGAVDEAWDAMLDRQIRRMHLAGHISASERDRGLRSRLRLVPHA